MAALQLFSLSRSTLDRFYGSLCYRVRMYQYMLIFVWQESFIVSMSNDAVYVHTFFNLGCLWTCQYNPHYNQFLYSEDFSVLNPERYAVFLTTWGSQR